MIEVPALSDFLSFCPSFKLPVVANDLWQDYTLQIAAPVENASKMATLMLFRRAIAVWVDVRIYRKLWLKHLSHM